MAGALTRDLLPGDLMARARARDLQTRLVGYLHPLLDVGGPRLGQDERLAHRREAVRRLAQQQRERATFDLEVVAVGDLLGHRLVVARLRLQRVHDGRGADLEVALGLRELLVDRGLLRLGQRHVVLREQHVEVGLRHAKREVLRGAGEHHLGLQHRVPRLVHGDPVLHAKDRLRQCDGVGLGGVAHLAGAAVEVVAEDRGAARKHR